MYKKSGTQQGIPAARTWLCLLNNMAANKTGSQLLRRTGPGNRGGRRKGKTLIGVNVWSATSATCSSINTLSALYLCSFSFFFDRLNLTGPFLALISVCESHKAFEIGYQVETFLFPPSLSGLVDLRFFYFYGEEVRGSFNSIGIDQVFM